MKIKSIAKGFAAIVLFMIFAATLIFGFAGIVSGFSWVWHQTPFGISGFALGSTVIALTFFQTRRYGDKFNKAWWFESVTRFGIGHKIAILFGFVLIILSQMWWFVPNEVLDLLPSFRNLVFGSLVFGILLYGVGGTLAFAVKGIRVYWLATLLFGFVSILIFTMINTPIWIFLENLPPDLYIFGKIVFIFFLIVEISYLVVFHSVPAYSESAENRGNLMT